MKKILTKVKQIIYPIKSNKFNNFIFIHINKTGGSSIEKALNIPFEHKTALEKIEEIGRKNWDNKLTFAIVRNPWDKVVSHYHYRVQTNQTNLYNSSIEFKEWVKQAYREQNPLYYDKPKMFMPQTNWISDENDNIIVDEVLRFENLEYEFNKILEKLEITATLPHVKKSHRSNYKDYYDEATISVVKNWFEKDIENFGYCFNH